MLYDLKLSKQYTKIPLNVKYDLIKEVYITTIRRIINYYRTRAFTLPNTNLLVRLLYTLDLDTSLNLEDYTEYVESQIPRIVSEFNIYSIHSRGEYKENFIYGNDSYDYIILTNSNKTIYSMVNDWENIVSIYPIYHTDYDLSLNIPSNNYKRLIPVYSVLLLDILSLAIQYKQWAMKQSNLDTDTYIPRFIRAYVLPNMLPYHVDICLINRLFQLFLYDYASQTYEIENKYPFYITDYTRKFDKVLRIFIERVHNNGFSYIDIINSLPTISYTPYKLFNIPPIPELLQIQLPLWLSRIEFLYKITQLAGTRTITTDKSYTNELKVRLQYLKSKRVLDKIPVDISYIMEIVDYLIRI